MSHNVRQLHLKQVGPGACSVAHAATWRGCGSKNDSSANVARSSAIPEHVQTNMKPETVQENIEGGEKHDSRVSAANEFFAAMAKQGIDADYIARMVDARRAEVGEHICRACGQPWTLWQRRGYDKHPCEAWRQVY